MHIKCSLAASHFALRGFSASRDEKCSFRNLKNIKQKFKITAKVLRKMAAASKRWPPPAKDGRRQRKMAATSERWPPPAKDGRHQRKMAAHPLKAAQHPPLQISNLHNYKSTLFYYSLMLYNDDIFITAIYTLIYIINVQKNLYVRIGGGGGGLLRRIRYFADCRISRGFLSQSTPIYEGSL